MVRPSTALCQLWGVIICRFHGNASLAMKHDVALTPMDTVRSPPNFACISPVHASTALCQIWDLTIGCFHGNASLALKHDVVMIPMQIVQTSVVTIPTFLFRYRYQVKNCDYDSFSIPFFYYFHDQSNCSLSVKCFLTTWSLLYTWVCDFFDS